MLRRLEKRIYIPLPDFKTRVDLFEKFLNSNTIELYPKVDFQELAAKTDGYSGSDIKLVCKEALMSAVRKMLPNMIGKVVNKDNILQHSWPAVTAVCVYAWRCVEPNASSARWRCYRQQIGAKSWHKPKIHH
ncbi:unnamed protein product [Diatraea saccharalis]|uniref:AAA ATPase AAA+ lid domain-containing protein n=1 Tax=Diatraea saccharalis TaxID=40085 RepID=A0A9N9R6W5_9NEOP|nr:unnamed protein product [Diatraea saccharalis]